MPRDFTRVHQRALGLVGPRPTAQAPSPTRLIFPSEVRQMITDQLYVTGQYRGGPLLGYRSGTDLTVVAAPLGGYRTLSPVLATDPLRYDEHYLLGWIDSLRHTSPHQIDWVGTWVMWPNSLLGSMEDELAWLQRGLETDLINNHNCLCTLGWLDGTLSAKVYTQDLFGGPIEILSTNL